MFVRVLSYWWLSEQYTFAKICGRWNMTLLVVVQLIWLSVYNVQLQAVVFVVVAKRLLQDDPYNSLCLPLYISVLVELKKHNGEQWHTFLLTLRLHSRRHEYERVWVFCLWQKLHSYEWSVHSHSSLVLARNTTRFGRIENLQWNRIKEILCHQKNNVPLRHYCFY